MPRWGGSHFYRNTDQRLEVIGYHWNPDSLDYEVNTESKPADLSSVQDAIAELRMITKLLNDGLNTKENLDQLRNDIKTEL
jgi:hypothetical protein